MYTFWFNQPKVTYMGDHFTIAKLTNEDLLGKPVKQHGFVIGYVTKVIDEIDSFHCQVTREPLPKCPPKVYHDCPCDTECNTCKYPSDSSIV